METANPSNSNAAQDPWAALEAQLDAPTAIRWEPKNPGDRIVVVVNDFKYLQTKAGDRVLPIVLGTMKTGQPVEISAGRAAIKSRLVEAKVQPGDMVAIEFEGEKQTEAGRSFFSYKAVVSKNGPRVLGTEFDPDSAVIDDLVPNAVQATPAAFGQSSDPWQTAAPVAADDAPGF